MIRRRGHWLVVCVACLITGAGTPGDTVVLVTGAACPLTDINALDLRKAYLGVVVKVQGQQIRPVLMRGDERLEQVFYQSVVAMSKKSYERRRLSLTLKYGTPRLAEFDDVVAVSEALRSMECGVTYLWKRDAKVLAGVKTVRLLWQGT
ncbi:MAG: hypothetical protein OEV10_12765 [Gammaproteobacteria bacterium]|nr:hypothetical protein [Gammaproteobacteria bacterium]MDH3846878.1 hypothetical protein [Gammaproteobacteria bacterium]MDH3864831.1 hypothetical protein [Gammaproteobacteria bacterium]MDH3905453.1 hypothetical protein [Gammaproteobacteria bacterium]MDH3909380.1 hypothetical protein [Gammaproteobacteria bacterium]